MDFWVETIETEYSFFIGRRWQSWFDLCATSVVNQVMTFVRTKQLPASFKLTLLKNGQVGSGDAFFIPSNAVHGIPVVTSPFNFFYVFARDSFDEIAYSFVTG